MEFRRQVRAIFFCSGLDAIRKGFLDLGAPEIGERDVRAEQRLRGNPKIVVVEGCIAVGAKV